MVATEFAKPVERPKGKQEAASAPKKKKHDIRFDYKSEITPHYFRHNYTTMLYNAGVDPMVAMRILGHADYATTARIYTHLSDDHIGDAGEKISKMLSGEKVAEKLPGGEKASAQGQRKNR